MKLVKIGRQGRAIKEYAMNDNASFNDLLKACNESIGPEDQLEINGNTQPLDRCDLNAPLVSNTIILIVNVPRTIRVKTGRVGERLYEVQALASMSAFEALKQYGLIRAMSENLFLKKSNDPHYDQDITNQEHTYRVIDGDILVLEKARDSKEEYLFGFLDEAFEDYDVREDHAAIRAWIRDYISRKPF